NRVDRTLLGIIRRLSDVVLVGAASVRLEGYRLPRTVPLAVVTGSGNLSGHRIASERSVDGASAGRLLVLCPASAVDTARVTLDGRPAEFLIVQDHENRLDPVAIVGALRDRGLASIVCEGGPSLAAQLLEAALVDEVCLSTSPVLGGRYLPLLGSADLDASRLSLRQLLVDDSGGLYARWSVLG
ncbi:MAG: dihydrofolate reductase family protein, partial [Lacisediminihabitans sp.]